MGRADVGMEEPALQNPFDNNLITLAELDRSANLILRFLGGGTVPDASQNISIHV